MTGGTIVHGKNLLQTVLFNTAPDCLGNTLDKAIWERPQGNAAVRSKQKDSSGNFVPGVPQGPADLAVWQSRRVRLILTKDIVSGVIISNGDQIPDAGANQMSDPMTPYRYSSNKSTKDHDVYYPRPYDEDRTVWRSLDALVVGSKDTPADPKSKLPQKPRTLTTLVELSSRGLDFIPDSLDVELVSIVYGPQSSSLASSVHSFVNLPTDLLKENAATARQAVRVVTTSTLEASVDLGRFAKNLLVAAGASGKETPFPAAVVDNALAELEPRFATWLSQLATVCAEDSIELTPIKNAVTSWERSAREVLESHARELLRGAGPRALAGRMADVESGKLISAGNFHYRFLQLLNERFPSTVPVKPLPTSEEIEENNGTK